MNEIICKKLLETGAVFLRPDQPFTWASGIKSPIYCDNRLILTAPAVRDIVEQRIADLIKSEYSGCQIIMGTATAGIAHAAIAAHILNIPMGYVRGSAKDHGRTNRIEGRIGIDDNVVIVEDLISTGASAISTANALRDVGANVLGIVSIFTYSMASAHDNFSKASLKNISLCDFDTLVSVAVKEGYINADDVNALLKFRDNPNDESWMEDLEYGK